MVFGRLVEERRYGVGMGICGRCSEDRWERCVWEGIGRKWGRRSGRGEGRGVLVGRVGGERGYGEWEER